MDINYTFVFYLIIAILVVCGGTYKLIDNVITAVLYFIGTACIFTVYGLRWFSAKNSIFSKAPVPWPPTINTCPDFLTYYQRTVNGAKVDTCIDMVGVSKNGSIKIFPRDGVEPMQDEYYFGLRTNSSDKDAKNQEWCQKAIASGLTWEGITNGESCTTGGTPTAPGGGAGAGACPKAE